jgi:hypothetical protein
VSARVAMVRLRSVVRGPLYTQGGGPDPQPGKKGEKLYR